MSIDYIPIRIKSGLYIFSNKYVTLRLSSPAHDSVCPKLTWIYKNYICAYKLYSIFKYPIKLKCGDYNSIVYLKWIGHSYVCFKKKQMILPDMSMHIYPA